jgi:hypothetical protein
MRRFTRLSVLALGVSALAFAVLAPGAGAGIREEAAPLTIVKEVTAAFPAGTTFTATIECVPDELEAGAAGIIDDGTEGGADSAVVTFGADGQPTSPDTITFDGPGVCTVTETANGGATSTTYACVGSIPPPIEEEEPAPTDGVDAFQVAPEPEVICPSAGPQTAPITVNIEDPDQTATVTITNTPGAPQAAPQVVAQPAFTG